MRNDKLDVYKHQTNLIKALAHPARLRILDILAQGEACVCHLTAILKQRQPYISQQLIVLREASLVRDRRDGTIVYYSLADQRLSALLSLSREILANQGLDVTTPKVPAMPVPGCSCPHCQELG